MRIARSVVQRVKKMGQDQERIEKFEPNCVACRTLHNHKLWPKNFDVEEWR
jgi:hypothetical protein